MKRIISLAIIAVISMFSILGCQETTKSPSLTLNGEKTFIRDVAIEKEYVVLPLYKILTDIGELKSDSVYDTYSSCCIEIKGTRYVIDFNNKLFISEDELIRLEKQLDKERSQFTKEEVQGKGLLPLFVEELGANTNRWDAKEIGIGNEAFIQFMRNIGIDATVEWNVENQTVNLVLDI